MSVTVKEDATQNVEDDPAPHSWVGASTVTLTDRQARLALLRGAVALPSRQKVAVLEVYCSACRRPMEDVADERCSAAINNEHLRGGPIGERKKRLRRHECTAACAEVPTLCLIVG